MAHKFAGHWDRLLSPERLRLQPPEQVLALISPQIGETVLDLGCGPGYLTLPLAEQVGEQGRVIAADISPEALEHLRATTAGRPQVTPLLVEEERLPLADGSVDAAVLVNVLHELVFPDRSLRDLARVLRPGGRLGLVDWDPTAPGPGPRPEERVPAERAADWLRAASLLPAAPVAVGAHFYGLAAVRG